MGRARIKKGGGRARFPLWEENPQELWVRIIRWLSMGIITENNERERERMRWKAGRVNPTFRLMPSPNYRMRACKKGRGTRTVHSLRGKSSGIIRGLSSENYRLRIIVWELSSENYRLRIIVWELSSENYDLVYHHADKLRFIGMLAYPKIRLDCNLTKGHLYSTLKSIWFYHF